jgi:putative transposase
MAEKRTAADFMSEAHGLSVTRSCGCVGLSRAAYYCEPLDWVIRDAEIIEVLTALVDTHPRWGFWKYVDALRHRGMGWNHKRLYRVYCGLGLTLPRRTRRKLPERVREPLLVPQRPNQVWSADFMSDTLYHGACFRTFNVIDDHNREALAIEIDTSLRAVRLVRAFERLKAERGLPDVLRVDNGPEFLSQALVEWCHANGVLIHYIQPGKPNQNAYIERFNRTYRNEVLNLYLFRNLDEVREITSRWLIEYNELRPHDALGGLPPRVYVTKNAENSTLERST